MKRRFFSRGLFEKSFMNSRITTAEMTLKEKILGYLVGPFGILAMIAVVNQLAELYYTERKCSTWTGSSVWAHILPCPGSRESSA